MRRFVWLLICLGASSVLAADEVRTWTDNQGRKMQAQFVREVDGDVTFLKDGKLVTMPLDKLSEEDQKFIRDAEANKKVEDAVLPAGAPRLADTSAFEAPSSTESKSSLTKQKVVVEERTWRDLRGKQQVGKFVRMHQGFVVISSGSRAIRLPYSSLSRPDRDYIRDLLAARGESAQLPPDRSNEPAALAEGQGAGEATPAGEPVGAAAPIAATPPQAESPPIPRGGQGSMGRDTTGGATGMATATANGNERMARMQEESRQRMAETKERNQQTMQQNKEMAQRSHERLKAATNPTEPESPQDKVGTCSNCRNFVTREQSTSIKCPHCGVIWQYEVDQFGHKKEISGAAEAIAAENAAGGTKPARTGWEWESRHSIKLVTRIIIPLVVMLFAAIGAAIRGKR